MIGVTFINDKWTISGTYNYLVFFQTKYTWSCKNKEDIKLFYWFHDKIFLSYENIKKENVMNLLPTSVNMSINDIVNHNNELEKKLLNETL